VLTAVRTSNHTKKMKGVKEIKGEKKTRKYIKLISFGLNHSTEAAFPLMTWA
jgi:hypothetical protein